MNKIVEWFEQLNDKNQKALLIAVAALAIYFLYSLVWSFGVEKLNRADRILIAEKKNLTWMQNNVPKLLRLKGGLNSNADLSGQATRAALANNLTISSYQPKGKNEAQIVFKKASFNKILAWLYQMEQVNLLTLTKLNISETGQKNIVDAQINISKGL